MAFQDWEHFIRYKRNQFQVGVLEQTWKLLRRAHAEAFTVSKPRH